jgi:uncharacterized protein
MQQLHRTLRLLVFVAFVGSLLVLSQPAQAQAACTDVVVQSGDSLSSIAGRYLGNFAAYQRVIDATNAAAVGDGSYAQIENANQLAVGWKLCIPATAAAAAPAPAATRVPAVPAATPAAAPAVTVTPALTTTVAEYFADRWDGTGPFPLSIEYLRSQTYPGSDIVIDEILAPGSNYNRYLVSYLSEGLRIEAYMTVPTGPKPATGWPVIVFNHGYIPPAVYRSTERYIAYVDGFARNGYIVLRPDYRGHGFSEGEARGAYGSPDYTIDVLNALASIKRYPDADPARVGMWGHSLGGFITLRAMVTDPSIKAGVIWAGVVGSYPDMIERWRRSPATIPSTVPNNVRRWRQLLQEEYGTPAENPAFWASVSANTFVSDLSGPVQLHHGTADSDVPVLFSELLNEQIAAAGGSSALYTYPGDDHNISAGFNTAMQRSIAFFDEHVK